MSSDRADEIFAAVAIILFVIVFVITVMCVEG